MSEHPEIMEMLMKIHGDIGELKGTTKSFADGLAAHLVEDKIMATQVDHIRLTLASQRGAAKVWTLVGSAIGAGLGAAGAIFTAWFKTKLP